MRRSRIDYIGPHRIIPDIFYFEVTNLSSKRLSCPEIEHKLKVKYHGARICEMVEREPGPIGRVRFTAKVVY